MGSLENRTAVVIGGTGAIGAEISYQILMAGCRVVVVSRGDRRSNLLQSTSDPKQLSFKRIDARSEDDVRRGFSEIASAVHRLSFLVYAAGLEPDVQTPLADYPLSRWHDTFDTYVTGFFLCFKEALKISEPRAHFLAISSAITRTGLQRLPPFYAGQYAMAKAALDEFCKWAKREANERGILLSRLSPGAVDTPAQEYLRPYAGSYPTLSLQTVGKKVIDILRGGTEVEEEILPHE